MADENRVDITLNGNIEFDPKQVRASAEKAGAEAGKVVNEVMAKWRVKGPHLPPGRSIDGLQFGKSKTFGFASSFADGVKGASLRRAAENLDMSGKSVRMFETVSESLSNSLLGGAFDSMKSFAAKIKETKPVSETAAAAIGKVETALGGLSQKAKDAGIKNLLLYGTNQTKKDRSVAEMRDTVARQRSLVESMTPTQDDRTLAARELNRGRWTAEAKQAVRDARERIKAYEAEAATLVKLEKQYEKLDKSSGTLFSNVFSKRGSRGIEKKLGVMLSKNSIFDKKTLENNGLLSTVGYKALRLGEIGVHGFSNAIEGLKKAASGIIKKNLGGMLKTIKQFKNVFSRRIIRSAVSALIKLAKEGLQNLKAYSKDMGTPFYSNVMRLATSLTYLKNAFAAMVAPLINFVTPALEAFMDLLANLANHIGAFFAAITGQKQFSAALKHMVKDANGAKSKLLDILGFDELNRLSGDTGGTDAYEQMFEEWGEGSIFETIKLAIESGDWEGLGKTLAEKVNSIFEKLSSKDLGKELGQKIGGAITAARAFVEKLDIKKMGSSIATWFNNVIGGINWTDVGRLIARKFTIAIDFFGSLVLGLDWSKVGKALGDSITGLFNGFKNWLDSVDWRKKGEELVTSLINFIKGVKLRDVINALGELLGSLFTAIAEGISGVVKGLLEQAFGELPDWLENLLGGDTTKLELNANVKEAASVGFNESTQKLIKDTFGGGSEPLSVSFGRQFAEALKERFGAPVSLSELARDVSNADTNIFHAFSSLVQGLGTLTGWGRWFQKRDMIEETGGGAAKGGLSGYQQPRNATFMPFASGGVVSKGQVFVANEAGPELVGTVGGRTTVTNQDQFTQGLADANAGVIAGLAAVVNAINNKDTSVYLDAQKVGKSVTNYQNNYARQYGV